MREPVRDKGRLEHMVDAIDNVNEYMQDVSYDVLRGDKMRYHAVVHNIQVVGEAAYKLTKEFCESHPEVPWRHIVSMRHILVHDYYNIDLQEVWNIVANDLSPLRNQLVDCLHDMED